MWSHPSAHYIDAQMFRNFSFPAVGICRSDCLILIMNVISVLHRQCTRVEGSGIRPRYVGLGIVVER